MSELLYKNADQMAFPVQASELSGSLYAEKGLTKREYFAAMVMQGFAAHGTQLAPAKAAVQWADALLAELSSADKSG